MLSSNPTEGEGIDRGGGAIVFGEGEAKLQKEQCTRTSTQGIWGRGREKRMCKCTIKSGGCREERTSGGEDESVWAAIYFGGGNWRAGTK